MAKDNDGILSVFDVMQSSEFSRMLQSRGELDSVLLGETTYFEKLKALARWYEAHDYPPDIDWSQIMTPIELHAYYIMQTQGLKFLPQYPVLRYHLDFAHPEYKVAVELDGKEFHDFEKDEIRDKNLADIGWTVIRIPGSEIFRNIELPNDINWETPQRRYWDLIADHFYNTGEGVIKSIKYQYFKGYKGTQPAALSRVHASVLKGHQIPPKL